MVSRYACRRWNSNENSRKYGENGGVQVWNDKIRTGIDRTGIMKTMTCPTVFKIKYKSMMNQVCTRYSKDDDELQLDKTWAGRKRENKIQKDVPKNERSV